MMVAAIPVAGMAAVIASQNYRVAADQLLARTQLILDAVAARHDATVDGTQMLLAAVARAPVLGGDPVICDAYLKAILDAEPGRYTNLAVVDASGDLRCSGLPLNVPGGLLVRGESFAQTPWFRRIVADRDFIVMPPDHGRLSGSVRVVAVQPILEGGQLRGAVFGALRLDWLIEHTERIPKAGQNYRLWLLDDSGHPFDVFHSRPEQLPAAELAAFVSRLSKAKTATARDGQMFSYATTRLGDGLRLLVGYDTSEDLRRARDLLIWRAGTLGLLLLLGIGAVAIGADQVFRVPLSTLTAAVRRWRGGEPFRPEGAKLPTELLELSAAFSETTVALAAHEAKFRGALAQREALMQEIHHRVKNNMQIVASLLNLQAARIRQPEAKAEFQSARDRVRALATLHRHLYAHGELHTINMRSFLSELCTQLFQAFGESEDGRIHLDIDAPELRISTDQAVPLALIVTETVSNAIKYAFPGERSGKIAVRLVEAGARASLVIEDDGVGPGEGEPRVGGIGMQLVRGFVRQIGGTMTIETQAGMCYKIDMPLHQEREASTALVA